MGEREGQRGQGSQNAAESCRFAWSHCCTVNMSSAANAEGVGSDIDKEEEEVKIVEDKNMFVLVEKNSVG